MTSNEAKWFDGMLTIHVCTEVYVRAVREKPPDKRTEDVP